jgi:hypothetical protein
MIGAYMTMPKHSFLLNAGRWKRHVVLDVLAPISAKNFSLETIEQFQEEVRRVMNEAFVRDLKVYNELLNS